MNLNKISSLIKKKRKSLGMTQTELANKLFVTEKAVSRWETGRGTPDISLLIPLSKELNIDVSELLNGEENNIEKVIEIGSTIREAGISTEIYLEDKKIKAKFKYADRLQIPYVAVIGDDEIANEKIALKDMQTGVQENLTIQEVIEKLK